MTKLKKHNPLPDADHVMRCVPRKLQELDEDGNTIGFYPRAFSHRGDEEYLSVNWLEYFGATHAANAAACRTAIEAVFAGHKNLFGVAQVGRVTAIARCNAKPVRVVYFPTSPSNPSHSALFTDHATPDTGREDLAREFYKERY